MSKDEAIQALQECVNELSMYRDCNKDYGSVKQWRERVCGSFMSIFADAQKKIADFDGIIYDAGGLVMCVNDMGSQQCFDNGIRQMRKFLNDLIVKLRSATNDDIRWCV